MTTHNNTATAKVAVTSSEKREKPIFKKIKNNTQFKCPKCGGTNIYYDSKSKTLICGHCRHLFKPKKIQQATNPEDIKNLKGETIRTGASDIDARYSNLITLKCTSCGAEIVIDTSEKYSARCHWCRNTLSINEQVPNGSVPDVILPFEVTKEDAEGEIQKFVRKRGVFAQPKFKKEFTTENIMGVYLPYMLVDVNAHAKFIGEGEVLTREYTVGSGDNKEKRYNADLYHVNREFDITIDDLIVESSTDKLNVSDEDKTNNVINAILPFDTENCVEWNANYLKGFTSEKRDTNVNSLRPLAGLQAKDVARHAANETLQKYDRGVRWYLQDHKVEGMDWVSAYMPVWLYSYQQKKRNGNSILHYVAVNARTKETMGSVPINKFRLFFLSFIMELIGIFIGTVLAFPFLLDGESEGMEIGLLFYTIGFIFYASIYGYYRNKKARHYHEKETKFKVFNMQKEDEYIGELKGLKNKRMEGANNEIVSGSLENYKDLLDI